MSPFIFNRDNVHKIVDQYLTEVSTNKNSSVYNTLNVFIPNTLSETSLSEKDKQAIMLCLSRILEISAHISAESMMINLESLK